MDQHSTTLEGTWFRLAPLSLSHHPQLCEIGLENSLWEFTTISVRTANEMLAYIQTALRQELEGTAMPFVIVERTTDRIVGTSRFHSIDRTNRGLEIGFTWIALEWQRTGVNTEVKYLMLQHAFEQLNCVRVQFKAAMINEKSRRALLGIGAKHEGVLRNYVVSHEKGPQDVALFSIIQPEWPDLKRRLREKIDQWHGAVNASGLEKGI